MLAVKRQLASSRCLTFGQDADIACEMPEFEARLIGIDLAGNGVLQLLFCHVENSATITVVSLEVGQSFLWRPDGANQKRVFPYPDRCGEPDHHLATGSATNGSLVQGRRG